MSGITVFRAYAMAGACWYVQAIAQAQQPLAVPSGAGPDGKLNLHAFIEQVRAANRAIKGKQAERDLALTGIERSEAIFQPVLSASAQRARTRQANTLEEDLIRQNLGVYERTGNDYTVGLSQLLSSGTKVEGRVTLSSFLTNIKKSQSLDADNDHRAFYGLSVTQPLLKDFGAEVVGARLRVAQLDTAAAAAASEDTESSVVAESMFAYWDLVLAQHRHAAASEKLRMGQRLLEESRGLQRQGRLSETDVIDVQSNVARFEAGLSEALLDVKERANRLRTLMAQPGGPVAGVIVAQEPLPEPAGEPADFDLAMQVARDRRDDLRLRRLTIEREDVQVAYARNQGLPRLDVVAGYGLNGLGDSETRALRWQQDYPSWNVGLQLSMPLGANKQGQADVAAAHVRRADAQVQLQALEVAVVNDIDTGISMMRSAAERWRLLSMVARSEQVQLDQERRRLAAGRSDMREILLREERAIGARMAVIEQQVAWVKAQVLLDAAQGVLLERVR